MLFFIIAFPPLLLMFSLLMLIFAAIDEHSTHNITVRVVVTTRHIVITYAHD